MFHPQEKPMPTGKYIKKEWIIIKEITKEGIEKLIKAGFIKNTGQGYVNPKKNYRVGYYKTCGGRRYIEDFYSDMANKLNWKRCLL